MRFNLGDYYDVALSRNEHNRQVVKQLTDFAKLGFAKVKKFFPGKGFGFDESGIFFHRRQLRYDEVLDKGGESWIMDGRIEDSPKGQRYGSGVVVNRESIGIREPKKIRSREDCAAEGYAGSDFDNALRAHGAKAGEWWWIIEIYYAYGSTHTFPTVRLTDEEAATWEATVAAHKAKEEQYRKEHPPSSSGSGSTSWTGVGLHPDSDGYYE